MRKRLLDRALQLVPKHGWSHACLAAAAVDIGLSSAAAGICGSPAALVRHHVEAYNQQLAEEQQEGTLRDRLQRVCRQRVMMTSRVSSTWPEALQTLPAGEALSLLHDTADQCWYLAGDRSTGMNYHVKRAALGALLAAAELHLLTDPDEDKADTLKFLEEGVDTMLEKYSQGAAWVQLAAKQ